MFGRNPLLPIQCEIESKNPLPSFTDEDIESHLEARLQEFRKLQEEVFQEVAANIKNAQEKQKNQYQVKKGNMSPSAFKVSDLVLRRNMLQKTKKGHKLEDSWLG